MILDAAKSGPAFDQGPEGDKVRIDYCTGQYWCTEYRPAVCRLLSSVIWHWISANASMIQSLTGHGGIVNPGNIRKTARRELGTSIARRWFK